MIENTYHGVGGHDTVIDSLGIGLDKLGYNVALGAFSFEKNPPSNMRKVKLNKFSLTKKTVDGFSYDLIHCHESFMNYYTLLNKKPLVYHFHGPNGILQEINFQLSMAICQNRISKMITVSQSSMEFLRGKTGKIPIEIIYNGVETDLFNPDLPSPHVKGHPQLLFVGNLIPSKNVSILIDAMELILKTYPQAHLQIIGAGPTYKHLKKKIRHKKLERHIELLGKLDKNEIKFYYSSCDVFVSPSFAEQHSITAFEAMACGKPVILSNIPPFREVLGDSNTGLTFSHFDATDIKNKLEQVFEKKEFFAKNTRKWAEEFSWDSSCKKVSGIYEELI